MGIKQNGETPGLLWGMSQTSRPFSHGRNSAQNAFKGTVKNLKSIPTPHVMNYYTLEISHGDTNHALEKVTQCRSRQLLRGDEGPGVGEWPLRHVSRRLNKLGEVERMR